MFGCHEILQDEIHGYGNQPINSWESMPIRCTGMDMGICKNDCSAVSREKSWKILFSFLVNKFDVNNNFLINNY